MSLMEEVIEMKKEIENIKENKEIVMIPFVAHESAMNRMERIIKWLIIVIILMLLGIATYLLIPNEVVEETSNTQDIYDITDSEIHQSIGD